MKIIKGLFFSIVFFLILSQTVYAGRLDNIAITCGLGTSFAIDPVSKNCIAGPDSNPGCPSGSTEEYYGTGLGTNISGCSCTCLSEATKKIRERSGLSDNSIPTIIGNILKVILGLSGMVALIFVVWGGIMWMSSKGVEDKISDAKKLMISGLVGLIIIASSYAITDFVIKQLTVAI